MNRIEGTTPFDASELKPCAACGRGVAHSGNVAFYEVTILQCVLDMANIGRLHGLEMMLGGAAPLARALSPDNTVAHRVGAPARRLLCQPCAMREQVPAALMEGA